jgi:RNA polymerase sigma-70 factor (ECF subfamily)
VFNLLDEMTFEAMVDTYQHRIYGFALNLCGNPADAEEIAQEAFLRAHRALAGYSEDRRRDLKWSSWLHQIALNVFRNRIRSRSQRPMVALESVPEPSHNGHQASSELRSLVSALPRRYREAIVLRHVQGFSYAEMAVMLARPEGTLKSDVHRGLEVLRKEMQA